jgi:hypothetical protein
MSFWAAARFDPHRSELALRHLAAQGFEAYLPKTRERVVTPYRDVERTTALFPGYLFVRIELQWRPVQMSLGIRALVMRGGAPARMQDHLIAANTMAWSSCRISPSRNDLMSAIPCTSAAARWAGRPASMPA